MRWGRGATIQANKKLAEEWENMVAPEVRVHYMIYPHPGKVEFVMPNSQGYDVSYSAVPAEAPYEGSEKSAETSLSNGTKQFEAI